MAVADGTYPFANNGYYFLIASGSLNSIQTANISGSDSGTGTYTYTNSNGNGRMVMAGTALGQTTNDLSFNDNNVGNYVLTSAVTGGQQHGEFIFFNGQSPNALAGKVITCTINDGTGPFSTSGSLTIRFATAGNTYTITYNDPTRQDSLGSYSYTRVNFATGKLSLNDSDLGMISAVFAYSDQWGGSFGIRNETNNTYQVGDFQVLDTTKPTSDISTPRMGQTVNTEVYMLSGRAADNVGVAYVLYSLNGADWLAADLTNSFINWSAQAVLTPGTNVLSVYAVDNAGNASLTNTIKFFYAVSSTLNLSINGQGRVNPSYNHALLPIGVNYSVTALPAAGFVFSGWTDGDGSLITNRPTLSFQMKPGLALTASFADTARPVVLINSPVSGQRLSNSLITASGKAKDNDQVSQVYYSLNASEWSAVTNGTNGVNWSAGLELVPGNNQLKAYAADRSGNFSLTNSVDFIYVLSAPISIHVTGGGKVTPLSNGSLLAIGQRYTMTAIPFKGFVFTSWTDGGGNLLTSQATWSFDMTSNLDFTAHFSDISKPMLTISRKPTDPATTSEFINLFGRAADNVGVSAVMFKLNDGDWQEATTSNGWKDWNVILDLVPGTNFISAYCIDTTGNFSATSSAKIIFSTAPASLDKFNVAAVSDSSRQFNLTFGSKTFCEASPDDQHLNGVGTYNYTRLSSCTGRLRINFTAPPIAANNGYRDYSLYFNGSKSARFTNNTEIDSGNWLFESTPSLTMTSLVRKTTVFISGQGSGRTTYFNAGKFLNTDLIAGVTNGGTTLSYLKYSPRATLLKQRDDTGFFYTVARYSGTNFGTAYVERYNTDGSYAGSDRGFFGFMSQPPGGNAPADLANRSLSIQSGNGLLKLAFNDTTFGQQSSSSDLVSGVGNYSYTLADANIGNLVLNYTAPADLNGGSSSTQLTFFAPNLGFLVNADNTVNAAVLSSSTNFSSSAPVNTSLLATNAANGNTYQFQFSSDGSFSTTGDSPATGSQTYTAYSPVTGLYQLTFATGTYAGDLGWLQLNYDSPGAGNYKVSIFDNANALLGVERGNFGQQ